MLLIKNELMLLPGNSSVCFSGGLSPPPNATLGVEINEILFCSTFSMKETQVCQL